MTLPTHLAPLNVELPMKSATIYGVLVLCDRSFVSTVSVRTTYVTQAVLTDAIKKYNNWCVCVYALPLVCLKASLHYAKSVQAVGRAKSTLWKNDPGRNPNHVDSDLVYCS